MESTRTRAARWLAVALVAMILGGGRASAEPAAPGLTGGTISYQAMLSTSAGKPLNGKINVTFRLYSAPSGGTALWTEARTGGSAITASNGLISVILGSLSPFPATVWNQGALYLGIQVGTDPEMTPRHRLGSVPLAASAASGTDGFTFSGALGGDLPLPTDRPSAVRWGTAGLLGREATGGYYSAGGQAGDLVLRPADGKRLVVAAGYAPANYPAALLVRPDGNIQVLGTLTHGALVEQNLMRPEEADAGRIERFAEGQVLCWDIDLEGLSVCTEPATFLVQAVAGPTGLPIVMGAEPVRVVGDVVAGDLLVASSVRGCAEAWRGDERPPAGAVIAQSLSSSRAVHAMQCRPLKAMIRKF